MLTCRAYFVLDTIRVEAAVHSGHPESTSTECLNVVASWYEAEWPEQDPTELADKLGRALLEWAATVAEERRRRAGRD